ADVDAGAGAGSDDASGASNLDAATGGPSVDGSIDLDGGVDAALDAAVDGAVAEPTYDPSTIPGLALWLRAGDATLVDAGTMDWPDRSPAGFVATSSICESAPVVVLGPNGIGKALGFPHPPLPDAGPVAAPPTTCLAIPDAPSNTSL